MQEDIILNKIREAAIKEELAIPLYSGHIGNALFWSGLGKNVQQKIKESLETLEQESRGHILAFKKIEEIYLNSQKNV